MGILEVRKLCLKMSGNRILNGLNIDFWEGHIHAVVGPNGAGKSTLASSIMGLEGYRDFTGDILFNGQSIKELSVDERARLGITLAWQEPARYEGLTVEDFVKAGARNKSGYNIRNALRKMTLDPDQYLERAVDKSLSGGERKKIELASIFVMEPRIVLLDEPDSGIDIESLERIFDMIRALKEVGTTVVMITHSLAVLKQADHAFLMCSGKIVDKGEVSKIAKYFEDKCIPCDHKNEPGGDCDDDTE